MKALFAVTVEERYRSQLTTGFMVLGSGGLAELCLPLEAPGLYTASALSNDLLLCLQRYMDLASLRG